MPQVILKFKDTQLGSYGLSSGAPLTIGRRETNAVIIDNLAVSGTHARIECREGGYLLTDLESKNGTFVNGTMVTTHWLQPGDVITIGKHTLEFHSGATEPPAPEPEMMDKTMILDTAAHRQMVQHAAGTPSPGMQQGVLSFLRGGQGEVVLRRKLTRIGRDRSADIVTTGFLMGATAATIGKRPAGYFLTPGEGLRRPKVNGRVVRGAVQLNEFDVIEIGSLKMEFILRQ